MHTYTTSLETSKALAKIGFKKKSEFWWVITLTTNWHLSYGELDKEWQESNKGNFYPAYLTDELLNELPRDILVKKTHYRLVIFCAEQNYIIHYLSSPQITFQDKFLPNALAKMIIYLYKEGFVNKE